MTENGEESEPELDEDNIPDVQTCQTLCEQFAALTGTDTACAQFFLQDRKWDLNRSVNAFFDAQRKQDDEGDVQILNDGDVPNVVISFEAFAAAMAAATGNPENTPTVLKFISWNIDGLDERSLKKRIKKVCNIINCELPDVVHLQEVVPVTYRYIERHLLAYKCITGNDMETSDYFTVTLIRKNTVIYDSHEVISFPTTLMGRNLILAKVKIADIPLTLLNTHLESTVQYSNVRKNQLKQAFTAVMSTDCEQTVLLGGDLNLRDKELEAIGGLPPSMEDLWFTCGKRPECEFTWDARRNSNIEGPASFKAKCRFDRVYMRQADRGRIRPKHFGLIGLEKIPSCGRFPSDHWGLMIHFDIN